MKKHAQESDVLNINLIEHTFFVRPGFKISITLPADLTGNESERLSEFIKCLPFIED